MLASVVLKTDIFCISSLHNGHLINNETRTSGDASYSKLLPQFRLSLSTDYNRHGFLHRIVPAQHQLSRYVVYILLAFGAASCLHFMKRKMQFSNISLLNPRQSGEFGDAKAISRFEEDGTTMLAETGTNFAGKPYYVNSSLGPVVVLPSELVDEVKDHPSMDMLSAVGQDFHSYIPGFEGFDTWQVMKVISAVARKQLKLSLGIFTPVLSKEATFALEHCVGRRSEWISFNLNAVSQDLIARLSTRAFIGEELCRNEAWLNIIRNFTEDVFISSQALFGISRWLRPIAHWFMPECKVIRSHVHNARKLLGPVIERRRECKRDKKARGEAVPFEDSTMEWGEQESKDASFRPELYQLTLSFVAVETSTDLLTSTMGNIIQHPEVIRPLREEIVKVLGNQGWKKSSLGEMRLLDSVMKETQRVKPPELTTIRRVAISDITLTDGTILPKGTKTVCLNLSRKDESIYTEPDQLDPYRFFRMREDPKWAGKAQFVSTSSQSLGFGHGKQACPGRFFAANEVKLAICHLLLKYDFQLGEGVRPKIREQGFSVLTDTESKVLIRSRDPELDLDQLV